MSGFESLLAILIVALMPVALVFISRYYALREKELSVRADQDSKRIEQLAEARRLLEGRVEALESIVCNVEFDLDQRLQRLRPRLPPSRRALPTSRTRVAALALGGRATPSSAPGSATPPRGDRLAELRLGPAGEGARPAGEG